jgi:hypothetical protein
MIIEIAKAFPKEKLLTVTDTWFGNNGLWKPVRDPPVLGKMSSLFFNLCVNHGGKEKHKLCP